MNNYPISSAEDILLGIVDHKTNLYDTNRSITTTVSSVMKDMDNEILNRDSVEIETKNYELNPTHIFKEKNRLEDDINHFNDMYANGGLLIYLYHRDDLYSIYDSAKIIIDYSNNDLLTTDDIIKFRSYVKFLKLYSDYFNELYSVSKAQYEEDIAQEEAAKKKLNQPGRIDGVFRDNIRKTVNHICSQVTSGNPHHSLGRLQELLQLLQGEPVPLVGSSTGEQISLQHPQEKDICWADLQNAILTQTETQFALNIDTAVVFSSLLAAIFGRFPDHMREVLNELLVRYNQLLNSDVGTENDEQNEQYLRGISRLLAALAVARVPPNYADCSELNPGFLWKLLVTIGNAEKVTALAAEAFKAMLEIGGQTMLNIYGDQFLKLLIVLKEKFQLVSGGLSIRSLILVIDDALEKNSFEVSGFLGQNSWF